MTLDEMAEDVRRKRAHVDELRVRQQTLGAEMSEATRQLRHLESLFEEAVREVLGDT